MRGMIQVKMLQRMAGEKETTSSKGNQNKWYAHGRWYKEDGLGYEALTEVLVSRLLAKTNIRRFVEYQYEALQREDRVVHGCMSEDFMEPGDEFDNSAALFSDVQGDYPLNMTEEECRNKIRAKPFSRDFDEQLDACELLFPAFSFRASFTMKDVTEVLAEFRGIYEEAVLHRVEETMRMQIRKSVRPFSLSPAKTALVIRTVV